MKALALYGEDVEQLAVQDTSRGEADQRRMITARCPDGRLLAVKAAKNSFTTPQRVRAWAARAAAGIARASRTGRQSRPAASVYSLLLNCL